MGVKQCDAMITAALSGQSVDLSELPDLQAKHPGIQQAAMQQNAEVIIFLLWKYLKRKLKNKLAKQKYVIVIQPSTVNITVSLARS